MVILSRVGGAWPDEDVRWPKERRPNSKYPGLLPYRLGAHERFEVGNWEAIFDEGESRCFPWGIDGSRRYLRSATRIARDPNPRYENARRGTNSELYGVTGFCSRIQSACAIALISPAGKHINK
jgi:hypothetical protein